MSAKASPVEHAKESVWPGAFVNGVGGRACRHTPAASAVVLNVVPAKPVLTVVPVGATTGNVQVTVGGGGSNGLLFTIVLPPTITSLSQTSGVVGISVTIVIVSSPRFIFVVGTAIVLVFFLFALFIKYIEI